MRLVAQDWLCVFQQLFEHADAFCIEWQILSSFSALISIHSIFCNECQVLPYKRKHTRIWYCLPCECTAHINYCTPPPNALDILFLVCFSFWNMNGNHAFIRKDFLKQCVSTFTPLQQKRQNFWNSGIWILHFISQLFRRRCLILTAKCKLVYLSTYCNTF